MPDRATQEATWAAALDKSRQQQSLESTVPLPVRQQHAKEAWQRHKQGVLLAIEQADHAQIDMHLQKAIAARARMMVLFLQELQSQYTDITDQILTYHTNAYMKDCATLAQAADALLTK